MVPIEPYSDEGERCACVVVEHDAGKPKPCPNSKDVTEEGWMALRGLGGKLLGVICPKHVPVFRTQRKRVASCPFHVEGHEN